MPPNRFESEVESFLEGSHGDRTHIKRADHPRLHHYAGRYSGITSAHENCTKNAHFAPAKAMAVSDKARPAPTKAMAVSDKRPSWPTGPGGGTHGWRRGLIGTYSHAIPPRTLHTLKCNR